MWPQVLVKALNWRPEPLYVLPFSLSFNKYFLRVTLSRAPCKVWDCEEDQGRLQPPAKWWTGYLPRGWREHLPRLRRERLKSEAAKGDLRER